MKLKNEHNTVSQVLDAARGWNKAHAPYDRITKLPFYQIIATDVSQEQRGVALQPLAGEPGAELKTFMLQPHAQSQLLARLEYPAKLLSKLPERLNLMNLNWLNQNNAEKDCQFRVIDGDQVRALVSNRYEPFDHLELLEMIEPYCPDSVVRKEFWDDQTFHLSITFPKSATAIKVGDIVEKGIHISNSEVGMRSVTILGYVFRLKCTNGAISGGDGGGARFRHLGNGDRIHQGVQAAIQEVMMATESIIANFKRALLNEIDKPIDYIERLAKKESLTQETFKSILDSYMEERSTGEGDNLYTVSQAISRSANKVEGDEAYDLQRLSVKALTMTV